MLIQVPRTQESYKVKGTGGGERNLCWSVPLLPKPEQHPLLLRLCEQPIRTCFLHLPGPPLLVLTCPRLMGSYIFYGTGSFWTLKNSYCSIVELQCYLLSGVWQSGFRYTNIHSFSRFFSYIDFHRILSSLYAIQEVLMDYLIFLPMQKTLV